MLADDIVVRDATLEDAAGIAKVHVDAWRTTYPGIIPDAALAALSYEDRTRRWEGALRDRVSGQGTAVGVAAGGQVVGFAGWGPERDGTPGYAGELYAIYILAMYQGRGLGRRLVGTVADHLLAAGLPSALVWVLERNPSRHFYARMGARPVARKHLSIAGVVLPEVAYGWSDVRRLGEAGGA